jgi:hypothetical protein
MTAMQTTKRPGPGPNKRSTALRFIAPIILVLSLTIFLMPGCKNNCEELADKVCKQSRTDSLHCEQIPDDPQQARALQDQCEGIRRVVATCGKLQAKAEHASDEDLELCEANLKLIRELEKAKQ